MATDQTERIVEPPENIQEKIAFIFNNLSQSNMTQKVSMMSVYKCLVPFSVMDEDFVFDINIHCSGKWVIVELKGRFC